MEDYVRVRRMHFHGDMSVREIARRTGFHRKTVRKMIAQGAPPEHQSKGQRRRRKLDPFVPIIDEILRRDKRSKPKQRHTAKRVFDRLRDEWGYTGGLTAVREHVAEARSRARDAHVPLEFGPGEAQVDWGEADLEEDGVTVKGHMFVMTLHFSDARFVACFPRETREFFLEGHLRAFEFFGGVPRRIVYDNLKAAVIKIGPGRQRTPNAVFARFCNHHLFEADFCNVRRGNEKGHVENGVGWGRRNLFVPIPDLTDWESFNHDLADGCRRIWANRLRGHDKTIAERLDEERQHLLPVPLSPAVFGQVAQTTVSTLCLVRFDTNDYSVPCALAHHRVSVHADVGRVRIFCQGLCVAEHTRCHGREQAIYNPLHYLPLVEQRPRTLDDGAPMKRLVLDECFDVLRRRMEAGQIHSRGTRAFIRILRLLEHHSQRDLTRAIKRALDLGVEDKEAIRSLLLCPPERVPTRLDLSGRSHLAAYTVKPPDLSLYASLAAGGVS
jgi:excisionase family DNA binding protein